MRCSHVRPSASPAALVGRDRGKVWLARTKRPGEVERAVLIIVLRHLPGPEEWPRTANPTRLQQGCGTTETRGGESGCGDATSPGISY